MAMHRNVACVMRSSTVGLNSIGSIRTAVSKPSKIKGGEPIINYADRKINITPGVNEPHYLKLLKPQVPFYELLNVQLKGYDHAVLDEFMSFVVRMTRRMKLKVNSKWITPNESFRFDCLQPQSYVVEYSNVLHVYERNVQIKYVPAHLLSIYIDLIERSRPTGVTVAVHPHSADHEQVRYIPDSQLTALKEELAEWSQPLSIIAERKRI